MDEQSNVATELPRYKCHKEVRALKIKHVRIVFVGDGIPVEVWIHPEDAGYAPFRVSTEYKLKHNPQPGGYYVVYEDGYTSFSPAEAFEEGYTRI